MDFLEAMPVTFKEIIPNYNVPEKWKEVTLNTGGTHSTLQDIKLPQKAGGYWYKDSTKVYTRNRFIYWQTTSDAIELSEASLDINLSLANLRCKVAPGTPPLSSITVYERSAFRDVVILAATVSSVHRLIFPHPGTLDKKSTFGPLSSSSPSIFHDTSAINNPNNYYILNQYSNATAGVAHTCSTLLRDNGEAVFALAFGHGGEGGLLIVKLPVAGSAFTTLLKRESTVPRFLSGLTGALRGKSSTDGVETYGVVLTNGLVVAICGDTCLRAWQLDEGGAPIAVSSPLSQTLVRPKPPPHGHMLQRTVESDGSVIMVAYLSFPNECEFVVMKMHNGGSGGVRFSHISRIFGPQLDLLDYVIGYGESSNVIWALWSQPDGDTIITCVSTGVEALWRAVASREAGGALPVLGSHDHYRDRLLAPALFPPAVIRKALVIYNRTWGNSDCGLDGDLGEAAMNAVQARLRHLTARTASPDHAHLMHKCWSDLYSWCMQYMESLQKPLGLMVSKHESDVESGWWCAVVRRTGISLVCELEPLERMMLSPDAQLLDGSGVESGELSEDAVRIVVAGARWERAAPPAAAAELEQRLFACGGPQHRLLPRLLHLLLTPADRSTPILTPHQIEELTSILNPIKDLQSAVLELNDALRLDVPEIETVKSEEGETDEYECLLASDLGVAIVTEAIRQMAEMRSRVVRGALCVLGAYRDAGGVPGAGHCAVHWQAYRALLWLRAATLQPQPTARCCGSVQLPCSHSEYPSTTYVPAGSAPATAPCTGRPTARCCGSVQLPCSHSEYPSTTYVPAGSAPATAPCTGRPTARCCGSVQLPCSHGEYPSTTYVPAGSAPATAPCTGRPTARCCGSVQLPCSHSEYPSTTYVPAGSAPATAPCTGRPTARCCGSVQLPCSHSEYPSTTYVPAGSAPATAPCTGRPTARCCGSVQLPCSHGEYPSTTYVPAGSAPATAPCTGRPTARCCGSVQLPCSHSEYPSTTYVPAGSAPATAPCTGRPTARCCGSVQLPCSHLAATVSTHLLRMYQRAPRRLLRRALAGLPRAAVAPCSYLAATVSTHLLRMYHRAPRRPLRAYRALLWLCAATLPTDCNIDIEVKLTYEDAAGGPSETFRLKLSALGAEARASVSRRSVVAEYVRVAGGARARSHLAAARAHTAWHHALPLLAYHLAHQLWAVSGGFDFSWWLASIDQPRLVQNYVTMLEPWCEWNSCSRQFILGLALLDLDDAEKAYTAFYKAAKGVSTEPFLRGLVAADSRLTQHQALVLYYVKVIKLFQIHDAGACVVRLAETAISIADTDDPNLTMFQWVVFKWHLSSGQTARALSAAAAIPARHTREAAAATLLTTLGPRRELGALVSCSALAEFAERAAAARAKLHDAHAHNPYYDFLYALYISRHHYRKAASIMYERAARCGAERSARGAAQRRRCEAAALTCLRLARPGHDFLVRPHAHSSQPKQVQVIGPEELAAELREDDPDSLDPVQRALLHGGNLDFDALYPNLKEADPETLLAVTKRAISTEQFLPHWFLERYMEVEGAGAVRALLGGGRAAEAGALCGALLKRALGALVSTAPPRDAPLGLADLILAELRHHTQDPYVAQVYTDLHNLVEEYVNVVKRTSQDMKLITCNSIKRSES
ncbi:unnamed protein product [Arctia plantaginis]|uniref:Nuclear pore complex protein Nup160 n=1 Tax=Arctia plantaginis TaxID=874455 RepID=A0A8S1BIT6_ARCPL|nr:unnamed protein product [Arctia plantaginis]